MSDESQIRVRPKDGDSSLALSSARSSLVARGRRDAALLTTQVRAESEERRSGGLCLGVPGVSLDYVEAAKWFKAAEQGDAQAQFWPATMYEMGEGVGQDYEKAAKWYREAAEQGHANAQVNLAAMYHRGQGVGQDSAEAARWYRKAAEQGHAQAQIWLGLMYEPGEGVEDYVEAAKWYRKAAEQAQKLTHSRIRGRMGQRSLIRCFT